MDNLNQKMSFSKYFNSVLYLYWEYLFSGSKERWEALHTLSEMPFPPNVINWELFNLFGLKLVLWLRLLFSWLQVKILKDFSATLVYCESTSILKSQIVIAATRLQLLGNATANDLRQQQNWLFFIYRLINALFWGSSGAVLVVMDCIFNRVRISLFPFFQGLGNKRNFLFSVYFWLEKVAVCPLKHQIIHLSVSLSPQWTSLHFKQTTMKIVWPGNP